MFSTWSPAADILSSGTRWLIKVELAGVQPHELDIIARDDVLLIRGRRRDMHCSSEFCYHALEIRYSQFERRITLPFVIDASRLTWQYSDGMLLIEVVRD